MSMSQSVDVGFGGIEALDPGRFAEVQIASETPEELAEVRANSALPIDSWEEMDDAVYRGEDATLKLVSHLRGNGLTTDVSIYDEELTWQPVDTDHEGTISMSPETETDEGSPTYGKHGVPQPVVHSNYSIGWRERGPRGVAESGNLDTLNAYGASYVVNRTFENMVLYGWEPTIGDEGYSLYGLANHPQAGTGVIRDWSTDVTYARTDIRNMKNQIKNEQNHSPNATGYWLYLANDLYDQTEDIVDQQSGDTILDRIESLTSISRIDNLDVLQAGSALMFRPTEDVIDLAIGEDLNTVQWSGPFRDNYKVMLAGTARVKSTVQGNSGIAYWQTNA